MMKSPLERFQYCPVCGGTHFRAASVKSNVCADCGFEYFVNPSAATVAVIRNALGEVLVTRRAKNPACGTLDLPGGFCDMDETVEQGVAREVLEETCLTVKTCTYLFSLPNHYLFSGFLVPTLDFFFLCTVKEGQTLRACDDAAELMWVPLEKLDPRDFGLQSISLGVERLKSLLKPSSAE